MQSLNGIEFKFSLQNRCMCIQAPFVLVELTGGTLPFHRPLCLHWMNLTVEDARPAHCKTCLATEALEHKQLAYTESSQHAQTCNCWITDLAC